MVQERRYAFPSSPVQELIRRLARDTSLKVHDYKGDLGVLYETIDLSLPDEYFELTGSAPFEKPFPEWLRGPFQRLDVAHGQRYFDFRYTDPKYRDALRLPTNGLYYQSPYAGELLSFGTGLLVRHYECHTSFGLAMECMSGEYASNGGIDRMKFHSFGTIIAKTFFERAEPTDKYHAEPWESTNAIMGDAYGELEQLAGSADSQLLDAYVTMLQREFRWWSPEAKRGQERASSFLLDSSYQRLQRQHIALQAVWAWPPTSPDELRERAVYILERVDDVGAATKAKGKRHPVAARS